MTHMKSLVLLVALVLTASLSLNAQSCSDLTIGGSQTGGGDLTFDVTGNAPFSPVFLLGSETAGTTDVGGIFTLGIVDPLAPFLVLQSDMAGDASINIGLPTTLPPSLVGYDIYVQALSLDFAGMTPTPNGFPLPFGICLSDVESFQLN